METKRNFFDLLALADVERVHSAVIGWLLSDECEALTKEERSAVLNSLFGRNDDVVYETIEVRLEWKHIDILWLTKSKSQGKECWVLENKVKSSQHGNQLDDYVDAINESEDPAIKGARAHYAYLTLTGEPAKCQNREIRYESCTYKKLVKELEGYFPKGYLHPNPDWTIANEYFKTIQKLVTVATTFAENVSLFPEVFGGALDGQEYSEDVREAKDYIKEYGLQILMQKYYQCDVMHEVVAAINSLSNELHGKGREDIVGVGDPIAIVKEWHVGETNRNADMAIHFETYPECIPRKEKDVENRYWVYGEEYEIRDQFDISFQKDSFKFAVSDRYWNKESWIDCEKVKEFVADWKAIFEDLKSSFFKEKGASFVKLNPPRGDRKGEKKRSRISISCQLKDLLAEEVAKVLTEKGKVERAKTWYELDRSRFVELVKERFKVAVELRAEAIRRYKERHPQKVQEWREENERNIKRKESEKEKK